MVEYELGKLIKIYNGKNYSHLKKGTTPVYGTGGIMLYVSDFLYEGKAILLPRKGSLSNIMYSEGKIWTVDTMYYASVNENIANPYYLYRYLTLLDLAHLDSGSTLPSMTKSAYTNLEINLPEITIQNKIANILSSLDSKIELNNKINKELESMAKTLYD
nr:restriction endonuclease subunit S [Aliarcobacter sp.]